jgi:hypothetical protein
MQADVAQEAAHVGEGVPTSPTRYFATLVWLTSTPSFDTTPWMRGTPQRVDSVQLPDQLTKTLSANADKVGGLDGATGPQ